MTRITASPPALLPFVSSCLPFVSSCLRGQLLFVSWCLRGQRSSARMLAVILLAVLPAGVPTEETFNRGLIAVVNDNGQIYLGWRLLAADPADVAFNVYRSTEGGSAVRVNPK